MNTKTRNDSKVKLSEEDRSILRNYVIERKIQQRALIYSGLTHRILQRALYEDFPIEKRKHNRLMQFCKTVKAHHYE